MIGANITPLGRVAVIQAGHPFRGSIETASDADALAVQMKDVDPEAGIHWPNVIRTHVGGRATPDWLRAGDLLFVCKGARFYATVVDEPPAPAVCNPAFFHLRPRGDAGIVPAFLAWQMNQPPFQRRVMQSVEGSGQLSIRRPVLESLPIAVPPLAQQQRMAALAADALTERRTLRALIANREAQLHALAEALTASAPPLEPNRT